MTGREWVSKVTVTEDGVCCQQPGDLVESVDWDDLQAVIIEKIDISPFTSNVSWILVGKNGACVVPVGSIGEYELLERLKMLEGFDIATVVSVMRSKERQRLVCWERK